MKAIQAVSVFLFLLSFMVLAHPSPALAQDFTGDWETNWGPLSMTQAGEKVVGDYKYRQGGRLIRGVIKGTAQGNTLTGTWSQPGGWGQIQFVLSPDGQSYKGKWRNRDRGGWDSWSGVRK